MPSEKYSDPRFKYVPCVFVNTNAPGLAICKLSGGGQAYHKAEKYTTDFIMNYRPVALARWSRWLLLMALFGLMVQACKQPAPEEEPETTVSEVITELPYTNIPLTSLEGLVTKTGNWQIVGGIKADFQQKHHVDIIPGDGVLLNNQTPEEKGHVFTAFEHGDIELDIEFLMPKGSNSGIYFQSRYEVQLFDSWLVEDPKSKDCGGIYERWDTSKPEGQRGYEGHPPQQNAARAPGLWQHLHIKFKAPRFDANGNKTHNAVFEEVIHNGIKIHENVEVTGPTRAASAPSDSEVPLAPLMIQGDHGPVAFRNIKFRLYDDQILTVANLTYDYFELDDTAKNFPVLDKTPVVSSGTTSRMNVDSLARRENRVAFRFKGNLNVPLAGDYLFFLTAHNGARFFIDNELVIPGKGRAVKHLTAGVHDIQVDYFNIKWKKSLMLTYEGPKQRRKMFAGVYPKHFKGAPDPLKVDPNQDEPEMIRAFVPYMGEKRTHTISVGDPARIHYSYDLHTASLLKVWRGGFADMSQAWVRRGEEQILIPQEMAVSVTENVLATEEEQLNQPASDGLTYKGYAIDGSGRPVFRYSLSGGAEFNDSYSPAPDGIGLVRSLANDSKARMYIKVAEGTFIEELNEAYFLVDGNHYLKMMDGASPVIKESNGKQEMHLAVAPQEQVTYAVYW